MEKKLGRVFYSITVHIILVIFLLLLPVVFLSGYINRLFIEDGIAQVERSHVQLLENYMSQIDHELDLAENYMNSLTFYNGTTVYLTDRTSPKFYYSANAINAEISKTSLYYQYISGFFLRVPAVDFRYTYIVDSGIQPDRDTLDSYIDGRLTASTPGSSDWQYVELGSFRYLIQNYQSNGICGGSFLCLDRLPNMVGASSSGVVFCSQEYLEEAAEAVQAGSVLLSARSWKSGLAVYEVLNQQEALASLPFIQRYLQIITAVMVLSLPLVYLALQRIIIRPLHRLTDAMRQLETGNMDIQLEGQEPIWEFQQIDTTFNHMTRQIKGLKIAVYEEQLQTEKTRLQNLSYQLRPHFIVNSLNMAYNMITCKDYAAALKLMRFSANYMRTLLTLEDDFVPLQEELKHLEDYMGIQAIRYEDMFNYETYVDPFLEDIAIPSMVLQNFIENSVKYSIGPDHFTKIRVSVEYHETDGNPQACVTVRDNGKGYPEWLLSALASRDLEALRDRIGLRNTLQRLEMLYGNRAKYEFFNDYGAVTRFYFPLDTE